MDVEESENTSSRAVLGEKQARRFLLKLAEDPFVCVVMTEDGIQIYSKDISAERLAQAKASLNEAMGGE